MLHQHVQIEPSADLPRANGVVRAGFACLNGRTRLRQLHQAGSGKAMLPPGTGAEMVLLNTSGGLTGGDRMNIQIDQGADTRLTLTTQTAERAYRSTTGRAIVTAKICVQDGAHLDWLPQETILFDHAKLARDQEVVLTGSASCIWVETIVLGRAAMGETVRELDFSDRRRITRDGRPIFVENLRLNDAALTASDSLAVLAGARAFASLVMVSPNAADLLAKARDAVGDAGAATAFDGKLIVRMMAADGWPLRQALIRVIQAIRKAPLPRVWQI